MKQRENPGVRGTALQNRIAAMQPLRKPVVIAVVAIAAAVVAGIGLGLATESHDSGQPAAATATPNAVDLTADQLAGIKIEPAATYRFPVAVDAVGSISLAQDPAIVQAESTLVAAAASFELTHKELARATDLAGNGGGVAQRELEQATSDQETAAAALKAARDAVSALGVDNTDIEAMIAAKQIQTKGSGAWLLAEVVESDSPLVHAGQTVEVHAVAFPDRTFHGRVTKVYATVDPDTHRVGVRCEIDDPVAGLRPGMLVDLSIEVQPPTDSVAIPYDGVVREGDGTMTAWVTTDRKHFTQRTVVTGLREDGRVQILTGVQTGELVVTDGAIFLDNMLQAPPSD